MKTLFTLFLTACATPHAFGAVFAYDEAITGDISNNYLAPLVFTPTAGVSTLKGSVALNNPDLFTIVVANGLVLDSIRLLSYATSSSDPGNVSYLLSQPRATLSRPPTNGNNYGAPIGYTSFGAFAVTGNLNLLPTITAGPPYFSITEFGAGSYAFWVNETGPASTYEFAFNLTAVPEPSVMTALLAGLPLIWRRRRV